MQTLAVLCAAAFFFPVRLHAAWAKVPIQEFPTRVIGAEIGSVSGTETIVLAEAYKIHAISWEGGQWKMRNQPFPSQGRFSISIQPGRNDGVGRIYVGAYHAPEFLELTRIGEGWERRAISVPGNGTLGLQGAISRIDGKSRLIVNRSFDGHTDIPGKCRGPRYRYVLHECLWVGGDWACSPIVTSCAGEFVFNPLGNRDFDAIFGLHSILVHRKGEEWSSVGDVAGFQHFIASAVEENVFYSDSGRIKLDGHFGAEQSRPFSERGWAIAATRVRPDGRERVYLASEDRHVYELDTSSGNWSKVDIGKATGLPLHLVAGDIRGDGRNHLYVTEAASGVAMPTTLMEYTYYQNMSVVAVLDFDAGKGRNANGDSGVGGILGNLLRSELSTFGHLDIVETKNLSQVLAEREFQRSRCADDACLAHIGTRLKARATIAGTLQKGAQGFTLELRVMDNRTGRRLLSLRRQSAEEKDLLPTVKSLARECALRWPHL